MSLVGTGGKPSVPEPSQLLSGTFQAVGRDLRDYDTVASARYRTQIIKTDHRGTHPAIVAFYARFQRMLAAQGYPFYAHEFLRDRARQAVLFEQGHSRARPGESAHNWGCAVDVIHARKGWELHQDNRKAWALVGAIGKEAARKCGVKLTWGGDWAFWDPAHWELENWREWKALAEKLGRDSYAETLQSVSDAVRYRAIDLRSAQKIETARKHAK
jgi:hypothetical protein